MIDSGSDGRRSVRSRIVAWALWDCGVTGMNAIVATFVFSVYLTGTVGKGLSGETSAASWLGRALAASGVAIAVLAPVIGVWVEAPHRRQIVLTVLTGSAVVSTSAMSAIRADPAYLWAGLALLAVTAACGDLASVPYNAMLRQLSTPQTSGRISGFGWAAGYVGSVVLLLVIYTGFIAEVGATPGSPTGEVRGWLHVPTHDGLNIRAAMLMAAAWFAMFGLPLLVVAPRLSGAGQESPARLGALGGYRKLWTEISTEWRRDRNMVYFLVASAIFRDGLAGVFAFGAVLGVNVYGISQADVLIFGVAASVVAALGAALGGLLDDRIGSKPLILGSLTALIVVLLVLLMLSGAGVFWVCGLLLCLFIGPAQSSARAMLLRMVRQGKEGVAFGLYTMTGRAVSFVAPALFSICVDVFHATRAGIAGLCVVLVAGLLAMLVVHPPQRSSIESSSYVVEPSG
ncbi:MAG: MFS transporter [Mycobacteriaceae bacterium]|nr:MFS transporter [Mycobacteriaceae bacterium]